jgi:coenzyme F420 biosynthesis associated uncharacterized protein
MGGAGARPGRGDGSAAVGGGRGRSAWNDRLWQAGFLVGSVLGAAATVAGRRAERAARRGLVDWPAVERVAVARLARAPGRLPSAELRAAEGRYVAAVERVGPALAERLGTELPYVVTRVSVVDRPGWVAANIAAFRALMSRVEGPLLEQLVPPGAGLPKATIALLNRWFTTRQLGFLLGFLGQRVLGQYDLALLSAETTPGRLLFVEENVRLTAAALGVDVDEFRLWIVLHEATHAFEFEAHPWLRPYLAERLEAQLAAFSREAPSLSREALRALGRSLRGEADGSWVERLMGAEQRRRFREIQAVMSVLEGFSDWVMDDLGPRLVPGGQAIGRRLLERRAQRTPLERAILRLTGLDLKLEQYRAGERFVAAVVERAGAAAIARLWSAPEALPSLEEIESPGRWLARVMGEEHR